MRRGCERYEKETGPVRQRKSGVRLTEKKNIRIKQIFFYYKNTLIILPFGLSLLNLQIIAIVMQMKRINRLKIVLAEQGKTGKWLAHALGKNESTVSRWCTNEVQPSVETLLTIAETLKIDIKELLCSTQICNQDDGIQI